ncbi:MAG TPA: hypothetical protein DDY49_00830 [Paenibacillaceae bacterium]|nr:hypothetical protein [Paenibacillaceae bacterium]
MNMAEERILRYAAPPLYKRMVEVFSTYHIHPYDFFAKLRKNNTEFTVIVRFSPDFSQVVSKGFTSEQVMHPDEEVTGFFEEAAKQCKSVLVADYYKIKKG